MITWQCIPQGDGLITLQATRGVVVWRMFNLRTTGQVVRAVERLSGEMAGMTL